jgi:hypothetical protein
MSLATIIILFGACALLAGLAGTAAYLSTGGFQPRYITQAERRERRQRLAGRR